MLVESKFKSFEGLCWLSSNVVVGPSDVHFLLTGVNCVWG